MLMRLLFQLMILVWCWSSLSAATIVCLGDSLTAGKGVEESQAYPALVEKLAVADGHDWRVVNAGISGDTTTAALRRIKWILNGKPDLVFIALGANDGLRGHKTEAMQNNLTTIIKKCQEGGAQVALAGMQLPINYGEDYRQAFSAVYMELGKTLQIPLLPFLLKDVGGIASLNQTDGIHPTAAGQEIIAKHVYAFLVPLMKAEQP